MDCSTKQNDFKDSISLIQETLKKEINEIVAATQGKTEDLSEKAEGNNDLTQGVITGAGTAIGTSLGGPAGGAAGAYVADFLTKFFVVETTMNTVKISLDLPQVTIKDQDWIFDLPAVTVKDTDIIFNLPSIRMKRVKTGEYPEVTCHGFPPQCTVKWSPIWADIPEPFMQEHRIVIGIPEFYMNEQKFVVGVPEITMEQQDISFDLPSITIKTRADIGKEVSDEAAALANETKMLVDQKKESLKERMKIEIVPKAIAMMNCFRDNLTEQKQLIYNAFDPAINQITESLKNLIAKSVPETDDDYIKVKSNLDGLFEKRKEALAKIDQSLVELEASAKLTIDSLTNA
ncbi:hypothetical protein [Chryseobacterium vrystaatense]|uniref:Uncharacterized protein n=1 Tax=Chryseobacterium vrystaatense TaxID=307480 RepID=A0ABR4UHP6_9FLAO|nr:hypothetical protein [Chryseobacterium vrystaatense]KFF24139.1 hypothetical protein IW16_22515 [Chryseobacterium vrystaatense]